MLTQHRERPIYTDKIRPFLSRLARRPGLFTLFIFGSLGALAGTAVLLLALVLWPTLPSIDNIGEDKLKIPLRVYSAEGRLIGEFGEEKRIPVDIAEVPKDLVHAIIATEDKNFYSHWGVDFKGVARAAVANFVTGHKGQGASTITMQVARNFFLSPKRTYTRKFKEMLLAFKLEANFTKDQILELYLNKIYLGQRAYGFAAAAKIYYGKKLNELELPEMAMLAGLPKAPSRDNPISNPDNALDRRNHVLRRMFEQEYIDQEALDKASIAPITASRHRFEYDVDAPYIAEMVRRYMYNTYREKSYAGGFHVHTTIRADDQNAANAAVRAGLLEYERRHGYRGRAGKIQITANLNKELMDDTLAGHRIVGGLMPAVVVLVDDQNALAYTQEGYIVELKWDDISWARRYVDVNTVGRRPRKASDVLNEGDIVYLQELENNRWMLAQIPQVSGALVALRPSDGAILALTGGFDFDQSHFNRVEQAERQPGSNIKPFIYSAALENGYTAASTISGAPIVIEDDNLEGTWRPQNYNLKFYGPTRLRKALMLSINTVSVRLLRSIGVKPAIEHLERFGFDGDKLPHNLSLALGSGSLTPLEVVSGFGVFANGGFKVEPYFISNITDGEGNIIEQANPLLVCPDCPETRVDYGPFNAGDDSASGNNTAQSNNPPAGTDQNQAVPANIKPTDDTSLTADLAKEPTKDEKTDEAAKPAEPVYVPRFAPRMVRPENIYIMTTILRDVIKKGTGRRAMVLKRDDLSGKTGTTNDFKDAWFSGFNPDVVATAWVGFDQPTTLGRGEAGSRAALPIWIDFMKTALKHSKEEPLAMPDGVVSVYVDPETGKAVKATLASALPDESQANSPANPDANSTTDPATDANGDQPAVSDNSDFDDPDAEKEKENKLPPIEEYFIKGTEPKVEITDTGEQKPVDTQPDPEKLRGLF